MREELLEELARVSARVEIGVILEDLAFLDADASWWPSDVRRHVLADGLYRRRFFDDLDACRAMADLWIRLKDYFGLMHPYFVRLLIHELAHYREARSASSPARVG